MPDGNEFQSEGAVKLKLWKVKDMWTWETDNRLVLEECRECAGIW